MPVFNNMLAGASGGAGAGYAIERSLRFNSGDSAYLGKTFGSAGNRKTWTLSCWYKATMGSNVRRYLFVGYSGNNHSVVNFRSDGKFEIYRYAGGHSFQFLTTPFFRDPSAWYHVVLAYDTTQATASDRVKLYINGEVVDTLDSGLTSNYPPQNAEYEWNDATSHNIGAHVGGGYADQYLADYQFIDGQALAATDFGAPDDNGVWQPKKFAGTYGTNGFHLDFKDNSSNAALGTDTSGNSNTWTVNNLMATIPAVDVGGDPTVSSSDKPFTYGYSVAFDGNDKLRMEGPGTVSGDFTWECWIKFTGTPSGRFFSAEESVNGTEYSLMRFWNGNLNVYSGDGGGYEANTYTGSVSADTWHHIAMVRSGSTVSHYLDGSRWGTNTFSNSFVITTLVLAQGYGSEYFTGSISNARFVNGQALYTGASYTVPTVTLTTTSQSATSSNVTTLVAHKASLTANDGTKDAIGDSAVIDSLVDSPTNGTQTDTGAGGEVVGNYATLNPLKKANITTSNGNLDFTHSGSTGYWQVVFSTIGMSSGKYYCEFTCKDTDSVIGLAKDSHTIANDGYVGYDPNGWGYNGQNGNKLHDSSGSSYGSSYTSGDIIGIALDADNGTLAFYKNGTSQGTAYTGLTDGPYFFAFSLRDTGNTPSVNFGQRAFAYPLSGYKSLNTANLPEPTIADSSKYFDTVLWSGDGSGAITVPGLSLNNAPGLVWSKTRNYAYHNNLWDAVRGFGTANALVTDEAYAEGGANGGTLNSATSSSLTFSGGVWHNENNKTYVAWNWDAGSSNTTIAAGSLNSSSYNQSQTWSNGKNGDRVDYPVTNVFDASLTTIGYGGVNQTITVTLPGGSIALTSLRVRAERVGTATGKFYVNGNDYTSQIAAGTNWNTITGETSITSIGYASDNGSNFVGLYAVEVNGKLLIDSGVSVTNVPTIASTVRANPSAGFSIVSYTGNGVTGDHDIAHGLNAVPGLVIIKNRTSGQTYPQWTIKHKDLSTNKNLLFTTGAQITAIGSGGWYQGGIRDLTSATTFGIGDGSQNLNRNVNYPSSDYIAYCFAPVEGYSAMGSYTGNGSADGPFVFTGMRPRWIMFKCSTTDNGYTFWDIVDTARPNTLAADLSDAEGSYNLGTGLGVDILSNGFKIRGAGSGKNISSQTYIYAAFAEHPFKTARAR